DPEFVGGLADAMGVARQRALDRGALALAAGQVDGDHFLVAVRGRQAGLRGQLLGESIVHAAQVQQRDPGRRPGRQVGQVAGIVEDPGLPVGGAQRALECRVVTTGTGPEMDQGMGAGARHAGLLRASSPRDAVLVVVTSPTRPVAGAGQHGLARAQHGAAGNVRELINRVREAGRRLHHWPTVRLAWTVTPCWTRAAAPLFCAITMMTAAALPEPFIALDMLNVPALAVAVPPLPPAPPAPPQDEASPLPPLLLAVLAPPVAEASLVDEVSACAWLSTVDAPAPRSRERLRASASAPAADSPAAAASVALPESPER